VVDHRPRDLLCLRREAQQAAQSKLVVHARKVDGLLRSLNKRVEMMQRG
jgi:hypothetical protein